MFDQPVAEGMRPCVDVEILLPDEGVIRVASGALFAEPDGSLCRRFVQRAFAAEEIEAVVIAGSPKAGNGKPAAELRFDARQYSRRQVLEHVAALLAAAPNSDDVVALPPACTARDGHGVVRYHRYGPRVSGWQVLSERIGAIKLKNPVLYRRAALCEAIERELMSVLGVDRYETGSLDCWVKIEYDPRQLRPAQLIEILDAALANAEHPDRLDRLDLDLADLNGLAAGRRDRPVRDAGAAAGVGGDLRLYRDPELPPRLRRCSSTSGASVSTSSTRSSFWAVSRP